MGEECSGIRQGVFLTFVRILITLRHLALVQRIAFLVLLHPVSTLFVCHTLNYSSWLHHLMQLLYCLPCCTIHL